MTGVACETGSAYSSGAPDLTLYLWRVHSSCLCLCTMFTDFCHTLIYEYCLSDLDFIARIVAVSTFVIAISSGTLCNISGIHCESFKGCNAHFTEL